MIDYGTQDFTKSGRRYDVILGVNGYHPLSSYRRALKPGGVYVMCGGSNAQIFQAVLLGPLMSLGADRKLGSMTAKPDRNDLALVIELVKDGKIRPVIDKCYRLESVPEAVRYLEEGHAAGKVVISVCD